MSIARDELEALKEQIFILESSLKVEPKPKKEDELKRYHEYLENTKTALKKSVEPTKFIRKMRRKGAFY